MKVGKTGGRTAKPGVDRRSGTEHSGAVAATSSLHEKDFDAAFEAFSLREVEGELKDIVAQLDSIGQRLVHERSVYNLREFTSLVKGFIERVVNTLYNVEQFPATTRRSSPDKDKMMLRVTKINSELENLAEDVLNRNKDALTIAEQYKLIRGLLVDIFAE